MSLQLAESKSAQKAYGLVQELQALLVKKLDGWPPLTPTSRFQKIEWQRSQGVYGGGYRYVATDEELFNRASVNISQVQYEQDTSKKLASATALSSIVHPRFPWAPSLHLHISWTEMKSGSSYWRIMADLNPSLPLAKDAERFHEALKTASGPLYEEGRGQGERYFYIPALQRHRGVAHFYLEEFQSSDPAADFAFAQRFGATMISCYAQIVEAILRQPPAVTAEEWRKQLAYHSLYFLQVLTLDRGTTSGILVHDENDAGILGSLPSHVDRKLLEAWVPQHPPLQRELLQSILGVFPKEDKPLVDDAVKIKIAQMARTFYQNNPQAQDLLARGDRVPPTQENHR